MMKAELLVKTPKGKAKSVRKFLQVALLGFTKVDDVKINKTESRIRFVLEGNTFKLLKLRDKATTQAMRMSLHAIKNNKLARKGLLKLANGKETYEEVMTLLEQNTQFEFKFLKE